MAFLRFELKISSRNTCKKAVKIKILSQTKAKGGKLALFLSALLFLGCASSQKNSIRQPNNQTTNLFSEIIKKNANSASNCPDVDDGDVCLMTWSQAVLFCKGQGAHLPTAREYAELLLPRGTLILETNEVSGAAPKDFYLVDSLNPDGAHDAFYMNHSNYKRPLEELGNHLLWTASIPPQHQQYAHVYYDEWGGGGGNPQDHLLTHLNAVQCVFNQ